MSTRPSPTALRRQLGAELRRLREAAHRTAADVAAHLGWSESKLSRIETARIGIRNADLGRLLDALSAPDDLRGRIAALAVQSRQKSWWEAYGDVLPDAYETYIGFEAEATAILNYEVQIVPGLLQTAEYASAIIQQYRPFEDPAVINQLVAVRMARQAVLTRDPPPTLAVVLDEAVLRRPIGGVEVMRRQLLWLAEAADRSMVTVQVLPFSVGGHHGLAGPFVILRLGDGDALVYSEGMTSGVFRSSPYDLRSYTTAFEAISAAALDPSASANLIAEAAELVT